MNQKEIITTVENFVKNQLLHESSGHDWWHTERVRQIAVIIAKEEQANIFICELAALLHDVADHKFGFSDAERAQIVTKLLAPCLLSNEIIEQIIYIINHLSYKSGKNQHQFTIIEGKVVQDADRLDAIGAIGISRAFAYGGYAGRTLYDPTLPISDDTKDTISHFYCKLLKLQEGFHTIYGKKLALERHQFMEQFLNQFYAEWQGKK